MEALIAALGVCFHVMCFYLLAPNLAAAERSPGRLSSPKRLTPKTKQNQTKPPCPLLYEISDLVQLNSLSIA